jgi:hypothetical protein
VQIGAIASTIFVSIFKIAPFSLETATNQGLYATSISCEVQKHKDRAFLASTTPVGG